MRRIKRVGRQGHKYHFVCSSVCVVDELPLLRGAAGLLVQMARGTKLTQTEDVENHPAASVGSWMQPLSFVATLVESKTGKTFSDKTYKVSLHSVKPAAFGTTKKKLTELASAELNIADYAGPADGGPPHSTPVTVHLKPKLGRGLGQPVMLSMTITAKLVGATDDDRSDSISDSSALTGFSRVGLEQDLDGYDEAGLVGGPPREPPPLGPRGSVSDRVLAFRQERAPSAEQLAEAAASRQAASRPLAADLGAGVGLGLRAATSGSAIGPSSAAPSGAELEVAASLPNGRGRDGRAPGEGGSSGAAASRAAELETMLRDERRECSRLRGAARAAEAECAGLRAQVSAQLEAAEAASRAAQAGADALRAQARGASPGGGDSQREAAAAAAAAAAASAEMLVVARSEAAASAELVVAAQRRAGLAEQRAQAAEGAAAAARDEAAALRGEHRGGGGGSGGGGEVGGGAREGVADEGVTEELLDALVEQKLAAAQYAYERDELRQRNKGLRDELERVGAGARKAAQKLTAIEVLYHELRDTHASDVSSLIEVRLELVEAQAKVAELEATKVLLDQRKARQGVF